MRVLSLFSGIGGFDLALRGLATETFFSEIEPSSVDVFQRHFPDAVALGDVRSIDWDRVGQIDLIVGGSPCTDVSVAAALRPESERNVRGLGGERSSLIVQYLDAIRRYPDAHFILENVSSMGRANREQFDKIVRAAAGDREVYQTEIDGSLFTGVQRRRIFWTSWPVAPLPAATDILWQKALVPLEKTVGWEHSEKALAYMDRRVKGGRTHWDFGFHQDTDRAVGRTLTSAIHKCAPYNVIVDRRSDPPIVRKMLPEELETMMGFPTGWTSIGESDKKIANTHRYKQLGNAVVPAVIAHILSTHPGVPSSSSLEH